MKEKIKLHPDVAISAVSLLFGAVLLFEIHSYPADVQMFPGIFIWLFMGFMAITLFQGIRKTLSPGKYDQSEWWCKFETIKNPVISAAFVVVYVALAGLIGFYIATVVYMLAAMYYFGSKNWKLNILIAVGMVIFCFVLFEKALSVTLPEGMLLKAIFG